MNTCIAAALLGFFLGVVFTAVGFLVDVAADRPRMEVCARCGKRWNVSAQAQHTPGGYICPHCASRERWPVRYADHPHTKKAPARSTTSDKPALPRYTPVKWPKAEGGTFHV